MARDLSGTSQYLAGASVTLAGSCTLAFTVNADTWSYPGNSSTVAGMFGKAQWGVDIEGDFTINIFGTVFQFFIHTSGGSTNLNTYATSNLSTGADHRFVLVYNQGATTLKGYVNGSEVQSGGTSGTFSNGANPITVGAIANQLAGTGFNGRFSECALWNGAALDVAEVAAYCNGFSAALIRPQNLAFYAPLLGRYSPEIDLKGAAPLTVTGATAADHPRVIYPRRRWAVSVAETATVAARLITVQQRVKRAAYY